MLDHDLFTVAGLERVHGLTRKLRAVEGVESAVSITTVQGVWGVGDALEVAPVMGPLPTDAAGIAAARARLMQDDAVVGTLLAADGGACVIHVRIFEDYTAPKKRAALHDRVAAVLADSDAETLLGGFPMVRVQYSREMLGQIGRLLLVVALVLVVVLALLLGGLWPALLTVGIVAVANVWTHGIMGAVGQPFTILSMLTPIIVMVVGVADSVHVLLAFRRAVGTRAERVAEAIRITAGPTALTSATTAVGFLALLTAWDIEMLRVYGLYTALGVVLAWVATMLLAPPLLSLFGAPGDRLTLPRLHSWMDAYVARAMARPGRVIAGWAVAGLALILLAATVSTDARILDGLPIDHPIMQTYRLMEDRFGGSLPMQVVYDGGDPADPDLLRHIQATVERLESIDGVGLVHGPDRFVRRFRRALMGGAEEEERLPDTVEDIAEIYAAASFSDPNVLEDFVAEDDGLTRIRVLLHERGAHAVIATQDALIADLNSRPLDGVRIGLAGTAYIAPRAWRLLQGRMLWGLALAVGVITLIFGVLFRSPTLALLSLIPNLFPLVAVLAAMALLDIEAKGNNAVIFSIAYGVAVDDTIHLLAQLRRHRGLGLPWAEAVAAAHRDVRGALTVTSIVLAAGFCVLLLSTFEFPVTLGVQMVVAVAAALAADLLLVPALLVSGLCRSQSG